jgi:hypothetical protein
MNPTFAKATEIFTGYCLILNPSKKPETKKAAIFGDLLVIRIGFEPMTLSLEG